MRKRSSGHPEFRGKYGIITVGAGIGGLVFSALMAKRGFDALLLEQSGEAGGCCRSMRSGGHTFDVGASVFYGLGNRTPFNFLEDVFGELGVRPEFKSLEPGFDIMAPDHVFHVTRDKRAFLRQLSAAYPQEARGLKRLYADLEELRDMLAGLPRYHAMGRWTLLKICALHPWLAQKVLAAAPRSLLDYQRRHLGDQRCIETLNTMMTMNTLLDNGEAPAFLASLFLLEPHAGGVWYPSGGSGAVASALLESLAASGGHFAPSCRVSEILVGGGRARGVRLSDGTEIHAERVVSDLPKEHTFGRMIDNIYLSDGLRKQVAYQENADSFFGVFLGVDADVVPQGTAVHTILLPRYDGSRHNVRPMMISIPSLADPSLAPEGRHTVQILSPEKIHGWSRGEGYEEMKRERAAERIAAAERLLPGLGRSILHMETLSPLTWERLTLRPGGTLGIKMDIRQGMLNRLGNKTEINNLYCVSDATFPGIGVASVAYSAMKCANLICRETGRPFPGAEA